MQSNLSPKRNNTRFKRQEYKLSKESKAKLTILILPINDPNYLQQNEIALR